MIVDFLKKIESSEEFHVWSEKTPNFFLASVFIQQDELQFGYFNSESNQMTTFFLKDDQINLLENQEILQTDKTIEHLNIDNIKLTHEQALNIAKEGITDPIIKNFIVIQNFEENTIFNITFFTQTQKIINVHVNSFDGNILSTKTTKLSDFYKVV
ncbi:hypothetical protein COV11_04410 [Candidatus Woesearchaeota archaeon CG10_big_fil_rev_8_21_14_0_10_30_7]|nr:MAG: hypothetical protein COV11_04410 [Candidatus Woesearchaeota archaeon CG10_big_fil_rev_8_21_14_0_10_30_7]